MKECVPVDVNDPSTHSAAYKLFHYYYGWMVPDSTTYTVNDTTYFGLATPLTAADASALANTLQPKQLRIFEVAALIDDGVPFGLVSPKFSVEIYEIITQHLNDWINAIKVGAVLDEMVPYEGLRQFNDLAGLMFNVAMNNGLIDLEEKRAYKGIRRITGNVHGLRRNRPKHSSQGFSLIAAAHYRATRANKREESVFDMTEDGKNLTYEGGSASGRTITRRARQIDR